MAAKKPTSDWALLLEGGPLDGLQHEWLYHGRRPHPTMNFPLPCSKMDWWKPPDPASIPVSRSRIAIYQVNSNRTRGIFIGIRT